MAEVDPTFYELIPWDYSSTKICDDAAKVSQITDTNKLALSVTARKGWLTRALKRVKADEEYNRLFNIKGKQTHNRYKDTLQNLEERMAMLINAFRRQMQLDKDGSDEILRELEKIEKTYWDSPLNSI